MASNNNSKVMKINMTKSRQTWALIGVILLLLAIVVALYYIRKNKSNQKEGFSDESDMSDALVEATSVKPNLTPATGESIVALFYADWCPHCQHFKPDFKKAMTELNGKTSKDGKKLRLVMVDCEAHKDLGRKYEVNGYPTVKILNDDGTTVEYDSKRDYESLRKYLVSDN